LKITILIALFTILGFFAVQRYVAYRIASAKFRDIVLRELSDFYPTFTRWNGAIFAAELKTKFPTLQAAVADFSASVTWYNKRAFSEAWVAYCNATGRDCDMNTYLHYFDSYETFTGNQKEATAKAQALFHNNVKTLLSYAHKG
jgi:hypothetical protein